MTRFPEKLGGLPDDVKASLIREAMVLAIKEQQNTIISREADMLYQFDTAFEAIGSLRNYDKASIEQTIAEEKQAINFFKEVYENAESQYFKIKEEKFAKGVDQFLKTKQKPKVVNKKENV